MYLRLETAGVSEEFFGALFQQLIRLSFFKKVKESTEERYHKYLPDSEHSQNDLVFIHLGEGKENPDAALILDRLNAKETPESMRALLLSGG